MFVELDLEKLISAAQIRASNDALHGNRNASSTDYIREDITRALSLLGVTVCPPAAQPDHINDVDPVEAALKAGERKPK